MTRMFALVCNGPSCHNFMIDNDVNINSYEKLLFLFNCFVILKYVFEISRTSVIKTCDKI